MQRALLVRAMSPFWIEEPTHPDDVLAHGVLGRAIAPIRIAAGEAVPNRVIFKNLLQADAVHHVQVDVARVGGVSEFIAISPLARKAAPTCCRQRAAGRHRACQPCG